MMLRGGVLCVRVCRERGFFSKLQFRFQTLSRVLSYHGTRTPGDYSGRNMTIMQLGRRTLARLRAAVPEGRVNLFVHAGNSLAVVASCSDEMVQLRTCMIGATTCGILYNLLQPIPQWTPTYWGVFFVSAHSIQIARILRERSAVSMGEREHELYEKCFMSHGWTPRMFLSLLLCH